MKSLKYLFLVSILILLMAACADESLSPIFFTLETERSLSGDRGLEDEMTIHEVVKVGGAGTRYFAAGNTLYTRTESGNWTTVSPPVSGALCNTLSIYVNVGTYLYAGFVTEDGDGLGLYRTDPTIGGWSPAAPGWDNAAFDAAVQNGVQIGLIKAFGTDLYVSTAENSVPYDYFLYASSNGTTFTGTNVLFDSLPSITAPILDIEVYPGTPEYWVIAGGDLYADIDGTLDDLTLQIGGPQTTRGFGGLLVSTDLYLSAKDGKLWRYNGSWSGATSISADGSVRFTQFVDVTAVSGNILVGTQGKGYYRLIGGDETNYERRPEYNISALYKGAINSLFLDTSVTPEALFAGTMDAGLWRADYIGGEWLWVQE